MRLSVAARIRQAFGAWFGDQKALVRLFEAYGRWLVLSALILVTVVIVSPFFYLDEVDLHEGEVLAQPVLSQIPFVYDDPDALAAWERRRETEYTRVYEYDSDVSDQASAALQALFGALQTLEVSREDLDTTRGLSRIAEEIERVKLPSDSYRGYVLDDTSLQTLWRHRNDDKFSRDLKEILRSVYQRGVIQNAAQLKSHRGRFRLDWTKEPPVEEFLTGQVIDYEGVRDFLTLYLRRFFEGMPEEKGDSPRAAAREVLTRLIIPNIAFSEKKSPIQRERFTEGRDSVRRRVEPGMALIDSGKTVTENELRIVEGYNTALRTYVTFRLLGTIGFVLLVVVIIGFFVMKFRRNFRFDIHHTLLTGLPLVVVLAVERLLMVVTEARTSTDFVGYLFFSGTIGMVGVLLLDVRLAFILVTLGCLLFGLQVNLEFPFVAVALLGGYTAVASLYSIRKRRDVVLTGMRIALVNAFGILTIGFIQDPSMIPWRMAAVGLINGITCSLLTIAILPWLELLFGVVTDISLLELTGLQHPLTQELERDAPGTWQHTLNVAKLAEAAAQAIGVNYLLVRAGTYFHDIGKMRKSTYFTENQASAEDKRRHQELRPQMSVLLIRDHVKSGIETARNAGLPLKIVDFIPEHHGTSLIRYFYVKALRQFDAGETKAPVREEDYRYPGPKPQSRETAIVMLADAVEATATARLTSPHLSEDDVRLVVHETVLDKFNDGQFDECDLTLNDLQVIRETFFSQLVSRFHTRIDYPKTPEKREGPGAAGKETREPSPARPVAQPEAAGR